MRLVVMTAVGLLVIAQAQAGAAQFTLAPLPYAENALEPVIDAETMRLHHGGHHRAYVDALNRAIAEDGRTHGQSLEQLLARAGTYAPAIRNNAGGHWNHQFFWETMAPPDRASAPSPELGAAIVARFGSIEALQAEFRRAGLSRFGSGWVWLVVAPDGRLAIVSTPNQDNPLMDVTEIRGTPILGSDLWEHAYYLTYRNRRADYLDAWWRVVDWARVSRRYAEARPGQR